MSNKILKYVRTVVFIAMVAGLIKCMDYAMMPSGYIRYIIHETDNADTDDGYDNIIIGFGDGTIYNYISNEKSIYKNKIKIAKNINYFTAIEQNINNKNVIQIKIGTGKDSGNADNDFGKTINYVLKYW